jgi:proteasome lid subunit RPN8/RPN11
MAMRVEISTGALARIVASAAASPATEICGLLLGTATRVVAIEPCRNVADDPARWFEIDLVALLAAHRRARGGGPALIGCYHSHPNGIAAPSPRDAEAAAPDGGIWLIVAGEQVTAWRAVADGPVYGRFTPLTIVPIPD